MAAKGSKLKKIYIVVSAALVLIVPCLVMDREDGNLLVRGVMMLIITVILYLLYRVVFKVIHKK